MPRRMIGPRFPSRTLGRGSTSHVPTFPVRRPGGQSPRGSLSGKPRVGHPITRSTPAPGTSSCASASLPSAVRASSRWRPGGRRSKRKRPSAELDVQIPASGSVIQTSPSGCALLVGHAPDGAVHLEDRALRPVRQPRADGLRADFRAALELGARVDREPDDVVQRHLVLPADRAPEVRLLALALADAGLDREGLGAVGEAAVERAPAGARGRRRRSRGPARAAGARPRRPASTP